MASRSKRPASRGFVNNIILESLLNGDKYGYEIIKIVEEKSNGKIVLKQPSLYSSLKRFEVKGYITSYWGDSDIGGRRHYYTLTETGREYYNRVVLKIKPAITVKEPATNIQAEQLEQLELEVTSQHPEKPKSVDDADYNVFELLENNVEPVSSKSEKSTEKINSIQVDMFSTQTNEIVKQEESVNVDLLQSLKSDQKQSAVITTKEETKKDIPLISETEQDFFSWGTSNTTQPNIVEEEEKFIEEEPIPSQKPQVTIDEHGIIKVGEPAEPKQTTKKIFDNVGARINYNDPVIKPKTKITESRELSEEEREEKNKQFTQKLDRIINEKTNAQNNEPEEIDYKNILGELLAKDESSNFENDPQIYENNAFVNYDNSEEDEYIETDTIEETVSNIKQSTQRPVTTDDYSGFKFKPYSPTNEDQQNINNFILINKARFNFGIISFILMILQISVLFIVLKAYNLVAGSDYTIIALGYAIAIVLLLICSIPYFIAPDKRAENGFRFNYTMLFGILLFMATCALTYAGCTFAGLNANNVSMFATKLLLPIILAINFIIAPLIYNIVLQDKKIK